MSTEEMKNTEVSTKCSGLSSARCKAIQSMFDSKTGLADQFCGKDSTMAHGTRFTDDDGQPSYVKVVTCRDDGVFERVQKYYDKLCKLPPNTEGLLIPKTFDQVPSNMVPTDASGNRRPTYYVVTRFLDGTFENVLKDLKGTKNRKRCMNHIRKGLEALEKEGLVHGDVQSKNMGYFVTDSVRHYVLFDFEHGAAEPGIKIKKDYDDFDDEFGNKKYAVNSNNDELKVNYGESKDGGELSLNAGPFNVMDDEADPLRVEYDNLLYKTLGIPYQ